MKRKLLDFLACVKCNSSLKLNVISEDAEVKEGTLICVQCGEIYKIDNYVPRMLPANIPNVIKKTTERFGYEWHNFPKLYEEYESQFLDWLYPINREFFKDKVILDAGCGVGRHTYYSAKFGAKEIIGMDLSNSVDVAYMHVKEFPNAHIVQADIYHPPFRKKFDYIYSIGVLHHLPRQEEGFRTLLKFLKLGGTISIWVYGKEGNGLLDILLFTRRITKNLPLWTTKYIAFMITLFLYPLIKLVYMPLNTVDATQGFAKKLPQNAFFNYLSAFNFTQIQSIFFDQLFPPIATYYTKDELEKWFSKEFKEVSITQRNNNSWRGKAVLCKEVL